MQREGRWSELSQKTDRDAPEDPYIQWWHTPRLVWLSLSQSPGITADCWFIFISHDFKEWHGIPAAPGTSMSLYLTTSLQNYCPLLKCYISLSSNHLFKLLITECSLVNKLVNINKLVFLLWKKKKGHEWILSQIEPSSNSVLQFTSCVSNNSPIVP